MFDEIYTKADSIIIEPNKLKLKKGEEIQIYTYAILQNSKKLIDTKKCIYDVAGGTITDKGVFTALTEGSFFIKVKVATGKDMFLEVTKNIYIQSFSRVNNLENFKNEALRENKGSITKFIGNTTLRTIRLFGYNLDVVYLAIALASIATLTGSKDFLLSVLSMISAIVSTLITLITEKGQLSKHLAKKIKKPEEETILGLTIESKK